MKQTLKAVEVASITKTYGHLVAVDDVSFDVMSGEFFGFLGPNGAGKTTLIRMLTTLLKPSAGSARVGGYDVVAAPSAVRRKIGVVPQALSTDLDLTGYENMDIYGRFYNIPARVRRQRIDDLLAQVGLSARAGDLVATYSGGMRRRLDIVRVLVHRPSILFLDEPTLGLDPQSRRVIWSFLHDLQQRDAMTIFLTTHYMEEAEALCRQVAIIDTGKIVAMGSPSALKSQLPGHDRIVLTLEAADGTTAHHLATLPFVHQVLPDNGALRVLVDNGARNLPLLIDAVHNSGGKVRSVSLHEQSLEDVFIHYTGKSIREETAKRVNLLIGAGLPQKLGR